MNGSRFVRDVGPQMTADLQAERDATLPGGRHSYVQGKELRHLTHNVDGTWMFPNVQGLAAPSLSTRVLSHKFAKFESSGLTSGGQRSFL